jgi:hypothetical protein
LQVAVTQARLAQQQSRGIKASTKARRTLYITNPATGQVFRELDIDTPAVILRKFDACKTGRRQLLSMPMEKRKQAALKFADLLEEKADELGKIMTTETGKPITQVRPRPSLNRIILYPMMGRLLIKFNEEHYLIREFASIHSVAPLSASNRIFSVQWAARTRPPETGIHFDKFIHNLSILFHLHNSYHTLM